VCQHGDTPAAPEVAAITCTTCRFNDRDRDRDAEMHDSGSEAGDSEYSVVSAASAGPGPVNQLEQDFRVPGLPRHKQPR
jgi:hypothetical protein